jgi:hypothetical protein
MIQFKATKPLPRGRNDPLTMPVITWGHKTPGTAKRVLCSSAWGVGMNGVMSRQRAVAAGHALIVFRVGRCLEYQSATTAMR